MTNYYDEIITKIEKLIDEQDYQQAFAVITNELSMPYIPSDIEAKLVFFLNEIKGNNQSGRVFNIEMLDDYLFSEDINKISRAINYLADSNIRNHLDSVREFLLSDKPNGLKCMLVDILAEQNITEELVMLKDDLYYEFTPSYIIRPCESEVFVLCKQFIETELIGYPTYIKMAITVLINQLFSYLPLNYDVNEVNVLALSIIYHVLKMMDDNELWTDISAKYREESAQIYEILV